MKRSHLGAIAAAGICLSPCGVAYADDITDFLAGSDSAVVLGATGFSTPNAAWLSDVYNLYLEPNGFSGPEAAEVALTTPESGTLTNVTALTTPESDNFGPSTFQDETDLTNYILAQWNAGDFSVEHPLTVVTYSQSSVAASLDEATLAKDGIPSEALRFEMLGDTSDPATGYLNTAAAPGTLIADIFNLIGWGNPPAAGSADLVDAATPNNLYPTQVWTIGGPNDPLNTSSDYWACYTCVNPDQLTHDTYLGLSLPTELEVATPTVEGLTTYFQIPGETTLQFIEAVTNSLAAGL